MKSPIFPILFTLVILFEGAFLPLRAQVPVTVALDPVHPGIFIPPNFAGLSYETGQVNPDTKGNYYFSPQNAPLIRLFRTLGIKSLRVGGNASDNEKIGIPQEPDIDSLFGFAQAINAKVIYTFRLKNGNITEAQRLAKYIAGHYAANLDCFTIGNEPNIYTKTYPNFLLQWTPYFQAISQAAPTAIFCGPSTTPGKRAWAAQFATDFGHNQKIAFISQHEYAFGAGNKVTDPAQGRDRMLSTTQYDATYQGFAAAVLAQHLSYRLEETNNFFNGGAKDVSNTYASALWGIDYLYWWASKQALGLNFHTGDMVGAGGGFNTCRYASFTTVPGGYLAHPLAYGLKFFDLGSHGQLIPAAISGAAPKDLNLRTYAVLASDKSLYVTLINDDHGPTAREVDVTLDPSSLSYAHGESIFLTIPGGDVSATTGETLGGGAINEDGSWQGSWTVMPDPAYPNKFVVKLPPATAAVVKLTP